MRELRIEWECGACGSDQFLVYTDADQRKDDGECSWYVCDGDLGFCTHCGQVHHAHADSETEAWFEQADTPPFDFDVFQKQAGQFAFYPGRGDSAVVCGGETERQWRVPHYAALGLTGEAGEVAEKLKKALRDRAGYIDGKGREAIKKELGDVLWYVAAMCHDLELSMADVAKGNIEKLRSRQERGKLGGSGDDR